MKANSREDIINLFMMEFDNSNYKEELLKHISRDEILRRLNENIQEVEYIEEGNGLTAEYNFREKKIIMHKIGDNISDDIREKVYKAVVIHEMWHAISNRPDGDGLYRVVNGEVVGEGVNEGFTQLITERMLGYSVVGVYQFEKETVEVLEKLGGTENLISDYIYGTSKMEDKMEEKYGRVGGLNYRVIRKNMDKRLVVYLKTRGIYRNSEEKRQEEQLTKEMKEEEVRVKNVIKNMLRREKIRVKEANNLDEFKKYAKLLETLNFCTELKDIEEFDLKEEMKVNSERLGKKEDSILKEFEDNIEKSLEEAMSEVTVSEINNQIRKYKRSSL